MFYNSIPGKILIAFWALFLMAPPYSAANAQNETGGALSIPFSGSEDGASYLDGYGRHYPYGFKISPDGSLFLANTIKNSILQFDFMGRLIKSYKGDSAVFNMPGDVTFDGEGMIYFADLEKNRVVKVDMLSTLKQEFGAGGVENGKLSSIFQIEIAPGKKLFVQDTASSRINVYSPTGAFIKNVPCNVPGFAINSKGQMLFFKRHRVLGYSLYLLEATARSAAKAYDIGLQQYEDFQFLGADYKGNVYVAAAETPDSERLEILVYNNYGALAMDYQMKRSPITRQFFIFGDGSIYSAEVDFGTSGNKPFRIAIRKR